MKCPACGYEFGKAYNYSREINRLANSHKPIKELLRKVIKDIPRQAKTTRRDMFYFLQGIDKIDNESIKWAIEQYYKGGHMYQGKGLNYLQAIIINHSKNRKTMKENERKRLGSLPPLIKE